ncbi:MAG: hypothetical protein ACKOPQ_00340 [Novosphingobium sp.]
MSSLFVVMLLSAVLLLKLLPDASLSRSLRQTIVAPLANWLLNRSRRDVIYIFVLGGLLLFAGEVVLMLGSADLVYAYALDLALYFDAVIAASLIGAARHARAVVRTFGRLFPVRRPKPRQRRTRSHTRHVPANDDDGQTLLAA